MVEDEGGERRQEAVGERFVIDAADDLLVGHLARFEEFPAQGDVFLEDAVHEVAAQHRTRPLVAQHVAQRRYVVDHLAVAAVARIGARAEDAGDAFVAPEQGACSAEQVRPDLDPRRAEAGFQLASEFLVRDGEGGAAPGAVDVDGRHGAARRECGERLPDLFRRMLEGVDASGAHRRGFSAVVEKPRAFGRSAVCNDYHVSKIAIFRIKTKKIKQLNFFVLKL